MRLRQVRKSYDKWFKRAKALQEWVLEEFNSDKQHQLFADTVSDGIDFAADDWMSEIQDIIEEYE